MLIGIQDGCSDGELGYFSLVDLKQYYQDYPHDKMYCPYWVVEVSEEDWQSWLKFKGKSTGSYSGRNYSAWERFWDKFTHSSRRAIREEGWPAKLAQYKAEGKL